MRNNAKSVLNIYQQVKEDLQKKRDIPAGNYYRRIYGGVCHVVHKVTQRNIPLSTFASPRPYARSSLINNDPISQR